MWLAAAAVMAVVLLFVLRGDDGRAGTPRPPQSDRDDNVRRSEIAAVAERRALPEGTSAGEPSEAGAHADAGGEMTDAERAAATEDAERRVAAFDAMIDRWMEPAPKGVTMDDVALFVRAFDAVPTDRREECLQRALNLVPDENVMLLVGILMDKRQDKELVTMVFNDILNREESVKRPILLQVYRDRAHPCWEDASWILSVTGETPAQGEKVNETAG